MAANAKANSLSKTGPVRCLGDGRCCWSLPPTWEKACEVNEQENTICPPEILFGLKRNQTSSPLLTIIYNNENVISGRPVSLLCNCILLFNLCFVYVISVDIHIRCFYCIVFWVQGNKTDWHSHSFPVALCKYIILCISKEIIAFFMVVWFLIFMWRLNVIIKDDVPWSWARLVVRADGHADGHVNIQDMGQLVGKNTDGSWNQLSLSNSSLDRISDQTRQSHLIQQSS